MVAAIIIGVFLICTVVGGFLIFSMPFATLLGGASGGAALGESTLQEVVLENNGAREKIAVIPVEGMIMGGGFDGGRAGMVRLVIDQLKMAARDKHVKAVLLHINSPGGEVLASDEISSAIERFQNEHKKPVIAAMGSLAASGGYYVAAPCRWIVANELTITGSIGVIMHTYNYRGLMNKVGLRPVVFKSGRFKDMLSGDKDLDNLSPAEKEEFNQEEAMIQKLITETFGRFKQVVGEGRQLAHTRNQSNKSDASGRQLVNNWTNYADGRVFSGKEAFEYGFVDELGDWRVAVKRARSLAGIESADLITYQPPFDLGNLFRLLGQAETKAVKLDLGLDLPKLQSGMYYVAPAFLR